MLVVNGIIDVYAGLFILRKKSLLVTNGIGTKVFATDNQRELSRSNAL